MATLYHGSAAKHKKLKVPRKNSGGVVWATTDRKTAEGYAALSHKRRFTGSSKHAYVHTMNESKSWEHQQSSVHSSKGPVKPSGGYWIKRDNHRANNPTSHPNLYNRHDRTFKSGAVAAVGIAAAGGGYYYYRRRKNKLERVRRTNKHGAAEHHARTFHSTRKRW